MNFRVYPSCHPESCHIALRFPETGEAYFPYVIIRAVNHSNKAVIEVTCKAFMFYQLADSNLFCNSSNKTLKVGTIIVSSHFIVYWFKYRDSIHTTD